MIDASRHRTIFSPEKFGERQIDIIGVGATGSRVALELAKLGVTNIHAWDFDLVERHNVANQIYGQNQIGQPKVRALQEMIEEQTGTKISVHQERVDGSQPLGEIVFLLTDTMSSRQEIWQKGLRYKPNINLVIETRMGTDTGRVYTITPYEPNHVMAWEATLHDDNMPGVERSACGSAQSLGPTAGLLADLAVWQLIRWFSISEDNTDDSLENEIVFSLRPTLTLTRNF